MTLIKSFSKQYENDMASKRDIVEFVRRFKDDILIPFAQEEALDAEVTKEAVDLYLQEIEMSEIANKLVTITKDGKWRGLHPLSPAAFEVNGRKFPSVTHFRYASYYFDADDECADYILEAKTPEIALRRGETAESAGKSKREDWEYCQESNLKIAYRALLEADRELRKEFLATKNNIDFPQTSDALLGKGADGKGKNLLPKVLKELRSEMN